MEKREKDIKEYRRQWYLKNRRKIINRIKRNYKKNPEKTILRVKLWCKKHPEIKRRYSTEYRARHPIKRKRTVQRYQQTHKAQECAKSMKYYANKLKALPKWITKEQLKEIETIYINRPKGYEIDHIIPLQSKTVCGLHVPWNLQYLTKIENVRKGNKY